MTKPIHHCYWVDQHRLLAGEYPRNRDEALSSAKLDAAPGTIHHPLAGSPMITRRARFHGSLLGLAVSDAVGTTVEFQAPGTFAPMTDMIGGGPFRLQKGEWTDDTAMALCLAASLTACGGFDARDQMDRYTRWWREGYLSSNGRCFDIGGTVAQALSRYARTGDPLAGATDPGSAGNGSLMRLAPIPLWYAADPEQAVQMSGESSRTTHGATACIDACRYLGALIVGAVQGASKKELLSPRYAPVAGLWERRPLCPEIDEIARGSFQQKNPPAIVGSGYVVKSLEAALWAFAQSATFREGCLLAVNLGHDADTTGAVYGQLAGAYYGIDGIPPEWLEPLAHADLIRGLADQLLEMEKGLERAVGVSLRRSFLTSHRHEKSNGRL